jgi:hypothetical protein
MAALSSLALADRLENGSYTYNDGNGSKSATVSDGPGPGEMLQIGDDTYKYNAEKDIYEKTGLSTTTISWVDQEYRYQGVNSSTGACTLYGK